MNNNNNNYYNYNYNVNTLEKNIEEYYTDQGPKNHDIGSDIRNHNEISIVEHKELLESTMKPQNNYEPNGLTSNRVQIESTFLWMKKRQYYRIQKGTVEKRKTFSFFVFFLFLCTYGSYLGLQLFYFHRRENYVLEFILMAFISASMVLMVPRFQFFTQLMLFEVYSYFYIFFIEELYYRPEQYVPIGLIIIAIIALTFLTSLISPHLYGLYIMITRSVIVKVSVAESEEVFSGEGNDYESENMAAHFYKSRKTPTRSKRSIETVAGIARSPVEHTIDLPSNAPSLLNAKQIRLDIVQKSFFSFSAECVYQGALKNGKPDGFGMWIDTSDRGEFLEGVWKDGIPIGPFQSLENGTRSMLMNLRIIFASNAGGKFNLERVPLMFGVASVESCVSGNFLKGYPSVDIMFDMECECQKYSHCQCVAKILSNKEYYQHFDDDKELRSVVISLDKNHLAIAGYKPAKPNITKVEVQVMKGKNYESKLVLDQDWISSTDNEGILFIHGYDHNLEDALKRFGQFLALGQFPPYLKPFVFNWPSSTNPFLYWCAHSVASDNDVHRDMMRFLISLREAGIRQLHIMCHSMGARIFLRSFAHLKNLFSLRLISPRNSFQADLDRIANGKSLQSAVELIHLVNIVFMNPDYELETFKNDFHELKHYCAKITLYADHRDAAVRIAFKMTTKASLGNHVEALVDSKGNALDIDLIDTGDLDRNTNSSFHAFFNINRLMVDDLWDLIVLRKSARERTSRLKRAVGGIYRFCILPSSVLSV